MFVRRRKVVSSLQTRRLNGPQQLARMLKFGTNSRGGKTAVQKKKKQTVKASTPVNWRDVGHLVHFDSRVPAKSPKSSRFLFIYVCLFS